MAAAVAADAAVAFADRSVTDRCAGLGGS